MLYDTANFILQQISNHDIQEIYVYRDAISGTQWVSHAMTFSKIRSIFHEY